MYKRQPIVFLGLMVPHAIRAIVGDDYRWLVAIGAPLGAAVLLLWIPLRQLPGLGTVSNVICIGLAADASMALIPELTSLPVRITLLVSGIVVNALATGMYIGAGFGAGPRDGLMTGIHARLGWSIRSVRTAIEVTVLIVGYLLGGAFGVGTVLYALTIGPLIQLCLPWFRQRPRMQKAAQPERIA